MGEDLGPPMLTDADSSDSEVEEDDSDSDSECNTVELGASGETAFQFLTMEQPNLLYICRKQESFKTSGFMPKYQH